VAEQGSAPSGIDTRIPNMARMYDDALGGKDNFAGDLEAVQKLFSFSPENKDVPGPTGGFSPARSSSPRSMVSASFSIWGPACPARAMCMKSSGT
jgi:S-adenosyl methyltransferase